MRELLTGLKFPQVPSLPPAGDNPFVLLGQGDKLWFSNGVQWIDVTAGSSGPKITASTVAPSSPSVGDLWIDMN